nr:hypothetical protein [Tanacetum cinerariifolium]
MDDASSPFRGEMKLNSKDIPFLFRQKRKKSVNEEVLAPSQSALFPTSHFSPFIIPKDFYTNLVDIPGLFMADTASESPLGDHPTQYEHRPVCIQLSKVELLLVAFDTQLKVFHTLLDDDSSCKHPKRDSFKIAFFELVELIIVTTYRNPIQMLVSMPFQNLELRDSNDSPLGIYIASRFPVNSETVELLTFTPPVRDSPKGVLVIVYWLLYPHCPGHQVFNPLDMPVSAVEAAADCVDTVDLRD